MEDNLYSQTDVVINDCILLLIIIFAFGDLSTAPPKPTDLQAHPDPEAGVVRVMWSDMRCNRRKKIFVTSYDLSICPRDAHVGDDHIQAQKSCKCECNLK